MVHRDKKQRTESKRAERECARKERLAKCARLFRIRYQAKRNSAWRELPSSSVYPGEPGHGYSCKTTSEIQNDLQLKDTLRHP